MLLVATIGLFAYAWSQGPAPDSPTDPTNANTTVGNSSIDPEEVPVFEAASDPHPVSIPALIEAAYDGSDLTLGRVLAREPSYTRYYITYRSDGLRISGILNVPTGDGPFPVLILNHGYIDPAVYTNGRGLKREQDYLARRGYAVLHPDYRCHADSDCPEADAAEQRLNYTRDVINAAYAVRASGDPRLDSTRIGMLGHSMGGGIAQNVAVAAPTLVRGIVLFAPVSSDYRDSFERYTRNRPAEAAEIIAKYGEPTADSAFWDDLASRSFFDRIAAPIQLHHGTADADVPLAWSEATVDELRRRRKDVEFLTYPGEPHEFAAAWATVMARVVEFFDRTVKD